MGKYAALSKDIANVFASAKWKLENIKTIPSDFIPVNIGNEYITIKALSSGRETSNHLKSVSGMLMVEIFTPAGFGPSRINFIADKLDTYLAGKTFQSGGEGSTQFHSSNLSGGENDKANPALYRELYTIPFTFFGV